MRVRSGPSARERPYHGPVAEDEGARDPRNYGPVLNTAQVAALLGLHPETVMKMAKDGRLPASRLPGTRKYVFLSEDLVELIRQHRVEPSREPAAEADGDASPHR